MSRALLLFLCLLPLTGCVTNPVTGANNFILYPPSWDLQTGAQQYGPAQQSQGGEYISDPALSRYVNQVGQRIAEWSDNPLPYEFVVLNNGVPNAWALPGGKIAVNRGLLLELNSEAELAAVLGHEIVHAAARHGAQGATRGALMQGALVVGAIASRDKEYSDYIVGAGMVGAQLINTRYGRDAERESDLYGIRYMIAAGYDPRAAISLQETFVRLSEGRRQDWLSGLFASHPPSQERVDNNRSLVAELSPNYDFNALETGAGRFQQATAHIRDTVPAYEAYDEAVAAVNERRNSDALTLVERARGIEPGEALFYGLEGDIHVYQREYGDAIASYNHAIGLNPNYFDFYVGRGVAHARQGNRNQAKADLEQSISLLPTSIASNELGKISFAAGNYSEAKGYFQLAAQGQGGAAQEARAYFARLDVQDNPNQYLQTELSMNTNGELLATVTNPVDVSLRDVEVGVQVTVGGVSTRVSRQVSFLNAGSSIMVNTGMKLPLEFKPESDSVSAGVLSARVAGF